MQGTGDDVPAGGPPRLQRVVVSAVALARAHWASLLWTWLSYPWYLLVLASYVGWLLLVPVPPIPVMLVSHAQVPSTTWAA